MAKPQSKIDFPADIKPVTSLSVQDLEERGGGGICAVNRYGRLSAQISFVTGYEHAVRRDNTPFKREDWEGAMHKSLGHLNKKLLLGLSPEALEVMTLCYTALANSQRFVGSAYMSYEGGENTGVHSLHTILQGEYVNTKALEDHPELIDDKEFIRNRQMMFLGLAVHDFGEILGEAGSLAQAAQAGDINVKDKSAFEGKVFDYCVRLATRTVLEGKGNGSFYRQIDQMRKALNVQNQGHAKSDDDMVKDLLAAWKNPPKLDSRGEALFTFLKTCWDNVENPDASQIPFVGYAAGVCERMQGGRHLNRHADTRLLQYKKADGSVEIRKGTYYTPTYSNAMQESYSEGKLAFLAETANDNSLAEQAVLRATLDRMYETRIGYYKNMGPAVLREEVIKETRFNDDGSDFTDAQIAQREKELSVIKKIAEAETKAVKKELSLSKTFNKAANPFGWTALTTDQIVQLYQKAIDEKFVPSVIRKDGKAHGEMIFRDLPEALVDHAGLISEGKKEKIMEKARKLIPPGMKK